MKASGILLASTLLLAARAVAGGDGGAFVVESFREVSPTAAVVVLRSEGRRPYFSQSCSRLIVELAFDPEPFWRRTWSREVSATTHAEALAELRRAAASAGPVHFGSMGSGLEPIGADPCVVRSRGLAILGEHDGAKAIYSYHDPI